MSKRTVDGYNVLAGFLTKYDSLDDVIEDKDESLLWELLKYETEMNSVEFDEVYTLAIESGLALPRCRHCGELTPKKHGRGRIRKYCGPEHNVAFRHEEVTRQKRAKARNLLRRKIRNMRDKIRRKAKKNATK